MAGYARRPDWLKLSPLDTKSLVHMRKLTNRLGLHTVCESARCPNRPTCFAESTATFMILGDVCTRNCTFCAVEHGIPQTADLLEPQHVLTAIIQLKLRYVVITSVTRDDLPDGGASQFAMTIRAIHDYDPEINVEVLVPDFKGSNSALQTVIDVFPTVINHNIETVPRLYHEVRPSADYHRSLQLLKMSKQLDRNIATKSGFMLGLGETRQEVMEVMVDLRAADCDMLTIGQYLQPSLGHHEVVEYIEPAEFEYFRNTGKQLGFRHVFSAPLVRSSFHAAETYLHA
jgi:lipoic acid synthetase